MSASWEPSESEEDSDPVRYNLEQGQQPISTRAEQNKEERRRRTGHDRSPLCHSHVHPTHCPLDPVLPLSPHLVPPPHPSTCVSQPTWAAWAAAACSQTLATGCAACARVEQATQAREVLDPPPRLRPGRAQQCAGPTRSACAGAGRGGSRSGRPVACRRGRSMRIHRARCGSRQRLSPRCRQARARATRADRRRKCPSRPAASAV